MVRKKIRFVHWNDKHLFDIDWIRIIIKLVDKLMTKKYSLTITNNWIYANLCVLCIYFQRFFFLRNVCYSLCAFVKECKETISKNRSSRLNRNRLFLITVCLTIKSQRTVFFCYYRSSCTKLCHKVKNLNR